MTSVVLIALAILVLVLAGPVVLLFLLYQRRRVERQTEMIRSGGGGIANSSTTAITTKQGNFRIEIPDKSFPVATTNADSPTIRWSSAQLTTSSSSAHSSASNASSQLSSGSGSVGSNNASGLRHKAQQHLSPLLSTRELTLGSLEFSLDYDPRKSILQVALRSYKAIDTAAATPVVHDDSVQLCVKLLLLPDKKDVYTSRMFRRRLSVVGINETFVFRGLSMSRYRTSSLAFTLLTVDRFSKKAAVGEVVAALSEWDPISLKQGNELMFTRELQPKQVKIKVQTVPSIRGQLLVSLCLQPNESSLNVAILKADKLSLTDDQTPEKFIFAKVYLFCQGQRIARRKTALQARCRNPVFNESMQFDLPNQASTGNISLKLVLRQTDISMTTKEAVPMAKAVSSCGDYSLGEIELSGKKIGSSSAKHWEQVVSNPRKQIAMWHDLMLVEANDS